MDKKPAFYEKQQFRQWWVWLSLLGPVLPLLGILLYQATTGEEVGDNPAPDDTGISVKFGPFHRKWRHYPWDSVTGCEVKRFNPMIDYGGWGIKGNSYTVAGKMGMLVRFKDRYSQMVGTQKPEELKRVLEQYGKLV